jgi:uncharacterized membrane protein
MSLGTQLKRWQEARLIDSFTVARILAYEESRKGSRFTKGLIALGALAIFLGFAAIVSSNWDAIPAWLKLLTHTIINVGLAGGIVYATQRNKPVVKEFLLFLLAGFTLTFIALIGQIYQTGAPAWQALSLWMLIVTPFLAAFARARFTIVCWIIGFWITLGFLIEPVHNALYAAHLDVALFTLVPFIMIGLGQFPKVRDKWPVWPLILSLAAYVGIALAASTAQITWLERAPAPEANSYIALVVGLGAAGLLTVMRRMKKLVEHDALIDLFAAVSVLVFFLPMIVPHDYSYYGYNENNLWHVIGAIIFILYWMLIGWTALVFNYRGLMNLAIVVIALRLVIVYCEVFGSLLQTGVGLIISGALLIALVIGTKKLMTKFKKLARPL